MNVRPPAQDRQRHHHEARRRHYLLPYRIAFDEYVSNRIQSADSDDEGEECPICRFPFNLEAKACSLLPCGHKGCRACLEYYFVLDMGSGACPVCKQSSTMMETPDGDHVPTPSPAPSLPRASTRKKLQLSKVTTSTIIIPHQVSPNSSVDPDEDKLKHIIRRNPDTVLNCSLVRREVTQSVKRKGRELHESFAKRTRVQQQKSKTEFDKLQSKGTRELASLKFKLTINTKKAAKQNSIQRRLITKLDNMCKSVMKENAELREALEAEKEARASDLTRHRETLALHQKALKKEKELRASDLAHHREAMRAELEAHGEEVYRIRKQARDDRAEATRDERETRKRDRFNKNVICDLIDISKSLQKRYDELHLKYSKQITGPFVQERNVLQQRISKFVTHAFTFRRKHTHINPGKQTHTQHLRLINVEQTWIDKVKERRSIYRSIQGRIKLLHKKKKLNDKIDQLRAKLRHERDRGVMAELRATINTKTSENSYLQNAMEELREQIQHSKAPDWMESMFTHGTGVRYPNEYVSAAVDMMAKSNIDASCMPDVMSDTFKLWLGNTGEIPNFASGRQFSRWREGVSYLCLIHIGYLIMKHLKNATIIQDGTPDDGYHIEAFTIHTGDMTIKSLPWLQEDKRSATSANGFKKSLLNAVAVYNQFYDKCRESGDIGGLLYVSMRMYAWGACVFVRMFFVISECVHYTLQVSPPPDISTAYCVRSSVS